MHNKQLGRAEAREASCSRAEALDHLLERQAGAVEVGAVVDAELLPGGDVPQSKEPHPRHIRGPHITAAPLQRDLHLAGKRRLKMNDRNYCILVALAKNRRRLVLAGEGYETPGKPPVAFTPVASRVGGNPPL
eukprot:154786-Prorocentrum_minimum.AAC.1